MATLRNIATTTTIGLSPGTVKVWAPNPVRNSKPPQRKAPAKPAEAEQEAEEEKKAVGLGL